MDLSAITPTLIISVVSILTTIILTLIFQWWRNRKILAYKVITNSVLFEAESAVRENLKVLYNEIQVDELAFVHLRIINAGRATIARTDFDTNLTISFQRGKVENGREPLLLVIESGKTNPSDLPLRWSIKSAMIVIEPLLLNAGDFFDIKCTLDSENPTITVSGRIDGVRSIRRVNETPSFWLDEIYGYLIGIIITLVGIINLTRSLAYWPLPLIFIGITVGLFIFRRRRNIDVL